jgi:putative membrane-bound dehydrogenase-like protein
VNLHSLRPTFPPPASEPKDLGRTKISPSAQRFEQDKDNTQSTPIFVFPKSLGSLPHLCPPLIFGLLLTFSASAQIPAPTDAPKPRTPEQSAAAFKLPPGFRMEVVASEPLIASPSGLCWDERGRMFVSELHGYNLAGQLDIEELNKTGKLDTQVRRVQADAKHKHAAEQGTFGVIKLLTDTDGDGRMDKATVFATNLPPAYGLVPARGGVIVACAPHILFFADRDGDGFAETREVLFTGFGTGELERGINAPQWGADGWIYFGRGWPGGPITGPKLAQPVTLPGSDFRIRADGSAIEPVPGSTGTFGFALTEAGDRFTVSTRNSFFIAPLPWHYLARNPDAAVGDLRISTGDARAYSLSRPHPWRQKRADDPAYSKYYRDRYGAAESDPTGWFTSACGPLLYQDHALPGLHGHYFLCEPSGNLIHRALVVPDGPALTLRRTPGEEQSEFAATTDAWSHPMHLLHGPDGAIWVVDYYREIIEDYSAIPRHLQQQYGLYAGHDRGRIYRLTHERKAPTPAADMSKLGAQQLAAGVASPLLWRRQTAQRLLVERNEKSAALTLRELLAKPAADGATLITALRTLDQLGALTSGDLRPFVSHSAESVCVHALQLADRRFAQPEAKALLDATLAAAATETHPRVQLQFALSLGESRDPRAFAMLARYARERLGVRWMDAAILSSLHQRGGEMLAELLREPGEGGALISRLAQAVGARRDEAELARTLNALAGAPEAAQASVLTGLALGRKNAPRKPLADKSARAALAKLAASPAAAVRNATRALEDTFIPAASEGETFTGPAVATITEVSDATFRKFVAALTGPRDPKRGHEVFNLACATCHRIGKEGHEFGPDLLGELGVAEETLVRHLLLPNERIRPGYETTVVATRDGASVVGLLKDDGATSLTLAQPNGVEQVLLRKDVTGVRRVAGSLMPSFAEALTPADLASLLTWLRSNLRPDAGVRAVLFDEEPGFAALLKEESGTATIESTGAAFGKLCLRITPPQRASKQLPGWNYRIVEKPAATNEFRFLRLSWRASGAGVMVELARSGQWPKAEDRNGRYHAGRNTTAWQSRETSPTAPREWDTVTLDLWRDLGAFTLTGLAPTAMGGDAWFDKIELLR